MLSESGRMKQIITLVVLLLYLSACRTGDMERSGEMVDEEMQALFAALAEDYS